MNLIKNIEGLIKQLNLSTATDFGYLDALRRIDIPVSEFEKYYQFSDKHHGRNQLVKTDDYELALICWEAGQQSFIHDYDGHEAWVHPISGKLRENRFVCNENNGRLEQVSSVLLGPGEYSYMHGGGDIHQYLNINQGRTISLHLYAKPIQEWTVYTVQQGPTGKKNVWWDAQFDLNVAKLA